jgi:hypothetical protein
MQQLLYWRMQVLSAASMWRPSESDRGSGRWYGAAIKQQALGACVESFQGPGPQGRVISPSLHGWHLLSRKLRAFRARLVVLFSRPISRAVARLHGGMGYT